MQCLFIGTTSQWPQLPIQTWTRRCQCFIKWPPSSVLFFFFCQLVFATSFAFIDCILAILRLVSVLQSISTSAKFSSFLPVGIRLAYIFLCCPWLHTCHSANSFCPEVNLDFGQVLFFSASWYSLSLHLPLLSLTPYLPFCKHFCPPVNLEFGQVLFFSAGWYSPILHLPLLSLTPYLPFCKHFCPPVNLEFGQVLFFSAGWYSPTSSFAVLDCIYLPFCD